MPMLLVALGGVFEFSWVFYQQKLIETGRSRRGSISYARASEWSPMRGRLIARNSIHDVRRQKITVYGSTSTTGFNPRVKDGPPPRSRLPVRPS